LDYNFKYLNVPTFKASPNNIGLEIVKPERAYPAANSLADLLSFFFSFN